MSALPLVLLTLAACQSGAASGASPEAREVRKAVELRDAKGSVIARLTEGRPCRASIDGDELIVGGRPLVMMLGDTRWEGHDVDGSTVLTRDGHAFGRIFPADAATDELSLFDREGVAIVRISVSGDTAIVRDASQSPIRELRRSPGGVTITMPGGPRTVTGTDDLLLAAVLSATEANIEVRALAACHRLLPTQKAAL